MGSYTSTSTSIRGLFNEARSLCAYRQSRPVEHVSRVLANAQKMEELLQEQYGFAVQDRDVLDIGAGQYLIHMYYFARHNRVSGIDYDVIAQGLNPLPYLRMLWLNGSRRTAKTIIRKFMGVDRQYREELMRQLNVPALPRLRVQRMDACRMTLPAASFDFVNAYSVFHHLADPAAALDAVRLVLRPGGVAYISLHLYTSETGSLDPRDLTGHLRETTPWAHLRPIYRDQVLPSVFLNRLRLGQWRELFHSHLPGALVFLNPTQRAGVEEDARRIKASGELGEYSLEELLTHELVVLWCKPAV